MHQQLCDTRFARECRIELITLDNDAVIVCAGGILPNGFLKEIGITVETKYGSVYAQGDLDKIAVISLLS